MKVGILGGGQLGRMMALAAHPLGIETVLVDPQEGAPASHVSAQLVAAYDDEAALDQLAACDVVTFEFENVPDAALRTLQGQVPTYPSAEALRVAQDRLFEKRLFRDLGVPVGDFYPIDSLDDLREASRALGGDLVLKTRRFGYDGKGQVVVRNGADLTGAYESLRGAPAVAEQLIAFDREVSVIICRARGGHSVTYPLTENVHRAGVLRRSVAPAAAISPALLAAAENAARAVVDHFDYVGVLALELFVVGDAILANEIAPRVHNSGHWTIEGARTSQFENHIRAITGLPLGDPGIIEPSAMVNLLGSVPNAGDILAVPDAHLHDYGKEPRSGRKVGHVTVRAANKDELLARIAHLEDLTKRS